MFVSVSMFAQSPLKKMTKVDVNPLTERTVTKAQQRQKPMQLKRMRQTIILIIVIMLIM